jgi:S-adenosylmethionine decarboxylase
VRDLAPDILRQRLLIEGFYGDAFAEGLDADAVRAVLLELAAVLDLESYGDPVVHAPASGEGKAENAGFDAFLPLIDSGISLYLWTKRRFFAVVLFTCKAFDDERARDFVRVRLSVPGDLAHRSF